MHKYNFNIANISCGKCVTQIRRIIEKYEKIKRININIFTKNVQLELNQKNDKIVKEIRQDLKGNGFLLSKDQYYWKKSFYLILFLFIAQNCTKYLFFGIFSDFLIDLSFTLAIQAISFKKLMKNTMKISDTVVLGSFAALFLGIFIEKENLTISSMILLSIYLGKYIFECFGNNSYEYLKMNMSETYFNGKKYTNEVENNEIVQITHKQFILFDGLVLSGESFVDESNLTGEIKLRKKEKGKKVFSGTFNKQGNITVKVTGTGKNTYLSRILTNIDEEKGTESVYFFSLSVIFCTIITFLINFIHGELVIAIYNSLSILILACPCGLSISEPLTILCFSKKLLEEKIVLRKKCSFERIKTVFIDKTGTITSGKEEIMNMKLNYSEFEENYEFVSYKAKKGEENDLESSKRNIEEPKEVDGSSFLDLKRKKIKEIDLNFVDLMSMIVEIEKNSSHPISPVIVNYCERFLDKKIEKSSKKKKNFFGFKNNTKRRDLKVLSIQGGICADFIRKGDKINVKIGSESIFSINSDEKTPKSNEPNNFSQIKLKDESKYLSRIFVAVNDRILLIFELSEIINPGIEHFLGQLRQENIKAVILSGDSTQNVSKISKRLGNIEFFGNLSGEKKKEFVEKAQHKGPVCMIGDGVNDYQALSVADLSIFFSNIHSDIGHFSILEKDFRIVAKIFEAKEKLNRKINVNFTVSIIYNASALICAFFASYFGFTVKPKVACVCMLLSSVSALLAAVYL